MANHGRLTDGDMQVAGFCVDDRVEELFHKNVFAHIHITHGGSLFVAMVFGRKSLMGSTAMCMADGRFSCR